MPHAAFIKERTPNIDEKVLKGPPRGNAGAAVTVAFTVSTLLYPS
jgi:hypothetical protein